MGPSASARNQDPSCCSSDAEPQPCWIAAAQSAAGKAAARGTGRGAGRRDLLVRGRHGEGEVQEELDGGHDDGGVAVQQAVVQDVHDVEHLLLGGRAVAGHRLQHLALRPL